MKKYRIYLDTSVVGGVHDDEFAEASIALLELAERGAIVPVLSQLLLTEINQAPAAVQQTLLRFLAVGELLSESVEAETLRDAYIGSGVVPVRWASDALHVAYATIVRVDAIASWNFKHLVNSEKIREFSAANLSQGYGMVVILTPSDVVNMVEAGSNEEED